MYVCLALLPSSPCFSVIGRRRKLRIGRKGICVVVRPVGGRRSPYEITYTVRCFVARRLADTSQHTPRLHAPTIELKLSHLVGRSLSFLLAREKARREDAAAAGSARLGNFFFVSGGAPWCVGGLMFGFHPVIRNVMYGHMHVVFSV
ncbi:hypothetical protein BU24DRAFT_236213 [Aaosphaeria arxii CBS 175.79]|uniref:Uncharacterized protein n=1 Tax=Aaosphaeria arxii CBS 175.79 TaxID=1450172 RepID=A0A6A5XM15_9PLEO|nr:uncharacterized protein BU24DRAFT_236213 [Aaosphaeria arxii CBS 175.79]KAF2013374.1 hypothetical protein BU24DRAFT_236213 [Aaosphaeria arxii CBS 175.79]